MQYIFPSPERKVRIIAAMTEDHVIGRDNKIPWNYPGDLKWFKEQTAGSVVIMGRKTWESMGNRALSDRHNIVVSKTLCNETCNDINFASSVAEAIYITTNLSDKNIWLIGGRNIYKEGFCFADEIFITLVPDKIPIEGSVLFPPFPYFDFAYISDNQHPHNFSLRLIKYRRVQI